MKPLRIAICDDDQSCLDNVEALLNRMSAELGNPFEILRYPDGADLTETYPTELDALFLDIEMPFMNGIETAREIRKRDRNVLLVLMSNYEKYAIHGYEFGAWRYLLKPVTWAHFERELRQPFEQMIRKEKDYLYVRNDSGVYSVAFQDLLYATTNYKKNVVLYLTDGRQVECYQTLSALEAQLAGHSFFRCHSGFLVNLAGVSQIGRDSLTLRDGERIPVSKHRRKDLMNAFIDFAGTLL